MYYERTIAKTIQNISDTFPVLLGVQVAFIDFADDPRFKERAAHGAVFQHRSAAPAHQMGAQTRSCFCSVMRRRC